MLDPDAEHVVVMVPSVYFVTLQASILLASYSITVHKTLPVPAEYTGYVPFGTWLMI